MIFAANLGSRSNDLIIPCLNGLSYLLNIGDQIERRDGENPYFDMLESDNEVRIFLQPVSSNFRLAFLIVLAHLSFERLSSRVSSTFPLPLSSFPLIYSLKDPRLIFFRKRKRF